MADVRTTAFTRVVKEKLFERWEFLMNAVSHDAFVKDKTVEIPVAGSLPDIVKDRSSFPIAITERTDSKKSYNLIEYSLGAIKIASKDKDELSYDKAQSIMRATMLKLNESIGLDALYNWSQTTAAVTTTGADAVGIAPPAGTGTRKRLTLADLGKAAAKLDGDNVPLDGRWAIIPAKVYWDFITSVDATLRADYTNKANLPSGVVAQILGFNIVVKPTVSAYTTGGVLKAVGAAGAATDNFGIVCYQQDEVCRAKGAVEMFSDLGNPVYQGDIYSGLLRFNAQQMRGDETGLVTIIQGA